jgi:hypothetical protein
MVEMGTIVVGVLAVAVSAIFNLATLQRSGRQFNRGEAMRETTN